jgi:hypothetical protein
VADTDEGGWGGALWRAADLVTPMAIRVAATLRLADHLASGPRTADDLAAVVTADPDALDRVMSHLVTAGILTRDGTAYGLTGLGEHLCDDHPGGVRAWIDLDGAIGHADRSFVHLLHTVRTGEPAYPQQYGAGYWDDLAANPVLGATFDALMGGRLTADLPIVADTYPWGALGEVVDVGGGNGSLLIAVLAAHRELRGTVLDLAGPVSRAEPAIAAAGLSDRAATRVGSFFDPIPAGAGGYVLCDILHDWDDEHAERILCRCTEAAGAAGKVLVIEHIDHETGAVNTEGDLRMLAYVRGRERTLEQLRDLGAQCGLKLGSVTPVGRRSILEFAA